MTLLFDFLKIIFFLIYKFQVIKFACSNIPALTILYKIIEQKRKFQFINLYIPKKTLYFTDKT